MYPQPGEIVEGKYRIERMLGEGAMGGVFTAFHTLRRANVALKFMSEQASRMPEAVERFMNEAVAASQIESDHVVKIFDVGRWGQLPYLVMEILDGRDLAAEIEAQTRSGQPMPVPRAVHFTLQILRALQVAHGRRIVHRDLKPANAFVINKDGEPDFVKILDFGISKQNEPGSVHLTRTNVSMGTPLYMAPEQAKSARDADARSDVYSVTCILYELLTGRPPHEADNYNLLLYKLFQEEPPRIEVLRSDLPRELAAVVHRGLSKDPSERVQSANELGALLAPFSDNRSAALLARMLARTAADSADWIEPLKGPTSSLNATTLVTTPRTEPSPSNEQRADVVATAAPHTLTTGTDPTMRPPPSAPAQGGAGPNAETRPYPPYTVETGGDPNAPRSQPTVNTNASTAVTFEGGSSQPVAAKGSMPLVLGALALAVALGVGGLVLFRGPKEAPVPAVAPATPTTPFAATPAASSLAPAPAPAPEPTPSASVVSSASAPKPAVVTTVHKPAAMPAPTTKPKSLKGMDIMK